MLIWFIIGLVIFILVFLSTRNICIYNKDSLCNITYIPDKLPIYGVILFGVLSFFPIVNLIFFIIYIVAMFYKIDLGEKNPNDEDAIYLINKQFNWVFFIYKILNKKI